MVKALKVNDRRQLQLNGIQLRAFNRNYSSVECLGNHAPTCNAFSRSARIAIGFLEKENIKVILHPTYSSDILTCDFWLFFNRKNMRRRFHSKKEIDVATNLTF